MQSAVNTNFSGCNLKSSCSAGFVLAALTPGQATSAHSYVTFAGSSNFNFRPVTKQVETQRSLCYSLLYSLISQNWMCYSPSLIYNFYLYNYFVYIQV